MWRDWIQQENEDAQIINNLQSNLKIFLKSNIHTGAIVTKIESVMYAILILFIMIYNELYYDI